MVSVTLPTSNLCTTKNKIISATENVSMINSRHQNVEDYGVVDIKDEFALMDIQAQGMAYIEKIPKHGFRCPNFKIYFIFLQIYDLFILKVENS
jgi:hypothetical protein